jgi:hypothetical protein
MARLQVGSARALPWTWASEQALLGPPLFEWELTVWSEQELMALLGPEPMDQALATAAHSAQRDARRSDGYAGQQIYWKTLRHLGRQALWHVTAN